MGKTKKPDIKFRKPWISVKDKLPPKRKDIPSISRNVLVVIEGADEVEIMAYYSGQKEWDDGSEYPRKFKVLAWRPLPRNPAKGKS